MKVFMIILKILETIAVCIWGVAVGIFFPVCILASGGEILPAGFPDSTALMVTWLITSFVGYVLPAALIFMKHYRVAAGMAAAGLVGVLIVHSMFSEVYAGNMDKCPTELYLPLIFVTITDLVLLAVAERHNISKLFEAGKKKKDEKAPSILGDD